MSSKTIRVLHLNAEKSWRGGEQQLAYLIEQLPSKDTAHFVACRKESAFEKYCIKNNITCFSFAFKSGISITTALSVKRICAEKQISIMHVHSGKSHSIAVISAVLGNKTPIILTRRVAFPIRENLLTKWKYNHPAVRKIICISDTVKDTLQSVIKDASKCVTVYSGIDLSRFTQKYDSLRMQYGISAEEIVVGNVAALSPSKDLITFINVADVFRKYHIPSRFLIMGEGPERQKLEACIAQKSLHDYVIITGFLPNIHKVLPELDVFATTTIIEGLGTSILDAFACHVPVVSTRAGGTTETVLHEKTGLLSDIADVDAMATNIHKIVTDKSLRDRLTMQAYQHLIKQFTKEKMAEGTLEAYQTVLGVSY